MVSNLRLFFGFCKFFGLIPVKNIFQDSTPKISLISSESFVFFLVKWFMYFYLISFYTSRIFLTILLSFVALLYDIAQLLHLKKLLNCFVILKKFENLHIIVEEKSIKSQFKWLGFILVASILNFLVRLNDCTGEIWGQIIFGFVSFPFVSIPVSFMAVCSILTQSLLSLDDTCLQFYNSMMNSNIFFMYPQILYLNRMESLRLAHTKLCHSVNEFIRFFDFPIFIYLLVFFLEIFYTCYLIILKHEKFHILFILKFIYYSLMIGGVTTKMDFLHHSILHFIKNLQTLRCQHLSPNIQNQIEMFIMQAEWNPVNVKGCSYVTINRQLLLTMATGFLIYFIVFIQLAPQLQKYNQ